MLEYECAKEWKEAPAPNSGELTLPTTWLVMSLEGLYPVR